MPLLSPGSTSPPDVEPLLEEPEPLSDEPPEGVIPPPLLGDSTAELPEVEGAADFCPSTSRL